MFTAVAVAAGVVTRSWPMVAALAGLAALLTRRPGLAVAVVILAGASIIRADASWASLAPDELGEYEGWATLVEEPRPYGSATKALVEIEGERFEMWVRGRVRQLRTARWQGGDQVRLAGRRSALDEGRAARVAWQHVVGEFEPRWLGDDRDGHPLAAASNRVRSLIERGANALPSEQAALTRGLVIGDDRDQSPEMIERFRASGLAHLTAVSGQSVKLYSAWP